MNIETKAITKYITKITWDGIPHIIFNPSELVCIYTYLDDVAWIVELSFTKGKKTKLSYSSKEKASAVLEAICKAIEGPF